MPACVECGKETARDQMYGVGTDLRCGNCANKRRTLYTRTYLPTMKLDGWVTRIILGASIILFLAGLVPPNPQWAQVQIWSYEKLVSYPIALWNGEYWRLWTTCLLHGGIFHILMNGGALWQMGPAVEGHLGRLKYIGLVLLLAGASMGAQVAVVGGSAVGLSGILFGMFGYLYALRKRKDFAAALMQPNAVQSIVFFFFLCIMLDVSGTMAIGNWAHAAGAAIGWLIGYAEIHPRRRLLMPAVIVLGVCMTSLALYMPWNADFCVNAAVNALERQDMDTAETWLARARGAWVPNRYFEPVEPP